MKNFLDGKKTYIVAACLVIFAITGVVTGNLTFDQAFVIVMNGLGLGSLRAGINKV